MEGKPLWMDYLAEARTVLAQIREPGAGFVASIGSDDAENAAEHWRKMIDAASAGN